MSVAAIARRSGVPASAVRRVLAGRPPGPSPSQVSAVALALGLGPGRRREDVASVLRREARRKAQYVARLVQGSAALEGQAVGRAAYDAIVERTFRELLAGPRRRLWS